MYLFYFFYLHYLYQLNQIKIMNIKYLNWKNLVSFTTMSYLTLISCTNNISENLGKKELEEKAQQWQKDVSEYMELTNWGPCSLTIKDLLERKAPHFEGLKEMYHESLSMINESINKESDFTKKTKLIEQKNSLLKLLKSTVFLIEELKNEE